MVAAGPLLDLTDEELASVDPCPAAERLVLAPHLDRLSPDGRDLAVATALRSLAARGLVRLPDRAALATAVAAAADGAADARLELEIAPPLALVLELRRCPAVVAVLQQTARDGVDAAARYLYVVDGDLVLDEAVAENGMHRFTLRGRDETLDALLAIVDPNGVAGLADTVLVTEVLVGRAGSSLRAAGRVLTVYAAADRVTLGTATAGTPVVTVQRLGAASLRHAFEEVLWPTTQADA